MDVSQDSEGSELVGTPADGRGCVTTLSYGLNGKRCTVKLSAWKCLQRGSNQTTLSFFPKAAPKLQGGQFRLQRPGPTGSRTQGGSAAHCRAQRAGRCEVCDQCERPGLASTEAESMVAGRDAQRWMARCEPTEPWLRAWRYSSE
eukprot:2637340-Rhodomonas_salina.3